MLYFSVWRGLIYFDELSPLGSAQSGLALLGYGSGQFFIIVNRCSYKEERKSTVQTETAKSRNICGFTKFIYNG